MNKKNIFLIIIIVIMFFSFFALFFIQIKSLRSSYNSKIDNIQTRYYKNKNPINLNEIIEENTKVEKSEKVTIEEAELEYSTIYKENNKMPNGSYRVVQIGSNGLQKVVLKQNYEDEVLINEQVVANNVEKNSTEKIIEIGTGKGYIINKINVGDKIFVSAKNLELKEQMDFNSNTVLGFNGDEKIEILKDCDSWFYISYENLKGYVIKEGVSTFDPNKVYDASSNDSVTYPKSELIANLSFDMDVSKQSNLSLQQFEGIFKSNSNDVNDVFKKNAKYFYYAEEQYNINGVFLASIAVHESAWGTSKIAKDKKNLFGYMAYDNSPYSSASTFGNYSEGIDLVARVLVKNYLNPNGTSLNDGSVASGRFFEGKTISSVNKHYATDKNWANCVYKWMQQLYNAIPE